MTYLCPEATGTTGLKEAPTAQSVLNNLKASLQDLVNGHVRCIDAVMREAKADSESHLLDAHTNHKEVAS